MPNLIFLKLGGSLITEKDLERTSRQDVILRLGSEIAAARLADPQLDLLIGHGSGSYGHTAARRHNTRAGVFSPEDWLGFSDVWLQARALNQIVIENLASAGLPVIAFPPSAFMLARDGQALPVQCTAIRAALSAGLIPVVNGDTVFDFIRGGTILSTEDVFEALAPELLPNRILLAGLENGVFADYPTCAQVVPNISPESLKIHQEHIKESASVDVTGGMRQKVDAMLALAQRIPGLEAQIFSGLEPGNLRNALQGAQPGTRIHA